MKRLKMFVSVLLVSLLALVPAAITANAVVDNDKVQADLKMFGIEDFSPESIKGLIDKLADSPLNLFGGAGGIFSDIIKELQQYLNTFENQMTAAPSETTTAAPETTAPAAAETTTEKPAATTKSYVPRPTYISPESPAPYVPSFAPATAAPIEETTSFQYIPPEQVYTEPVTTMVFSPQVDDSGSKEDDSHPAKTALGAAMLMLSGVGAIGVAVKLKKTNI